MIKVNISEVKPNPKNPRVIKDAKFKKLVTSIKEFPDMLNKRPLIVFTDVDGKYCVLGGNMRLKALNELKYTEIPIIIADEWTEEQKNEFLIKDNVGFGEWDWDQLANEWEIEKLEKWGLEIPNISNIDDIYTTKIESPIYQTTGEKPEILKLYNLGKYNELMDQINRSNLPDDEKLFLQLAATRHIEFNYKNAAEYYAHSNIEMQELMENSALVIIDYNKAIELGFVKLFKTLENLSEIDE